MSTRTLRRAAIGALLGAPVAALTFPQLAFAHALASRADLPVPAWLFAWGASIVLIVSFFALAAGWKTSRFEKEDWRPVGSQGLSRSLFNPATESLAGLLAVLLLGLTVWSGLYGTEAPDRNFSLTFAFVTVWLGFPLMSVLFGDVFPPFNPWRAIGRVCGGAFRAVAGQAPAHIRYPDRLGRWPAVAGLVAYVWIELIDGASGVSVGLLPHTAGVAALAYTLYTLTMMALFGVEQWCQRGETFSVYFNMFSQLSAVEVRHRRIGKRRPFTGATHWAMVPGSIALVVASIGTTSFDGAQEGVLQSEIVNTFNKLAKAGVSLPNALRLSESIWLLVCLAGVAALFLLGVQGMRTIRKAPPFKVLRTDFAHTLIPIAIAYLVAHYFSFFVYQEQAQFTYLISDPLGSGANIFGTTSSTVDYNVINAQMIWYAQVGALVLGHVCGLTLAHDKAIAVWKEKELASRSQYWMLAVMVGFTCFGLYLLSQSNR